MLNKIAPVSFPKKLPLRFHVRENQNLFARPASVKVPQPAGGILPIHIHRRPFGKQANDILDGRDIAGDALEDVLLKFRLRGRRWHRFRGNRTAVFAAQQMTTRQQVSRVRCRLYFVDQFAFAPRWQTPLIELAQQHQRVGFTEREPMHQHCRDIKCRVVTALAADCRQTLGNVSACPF